MVATTSPAATRRAIPREPRVRVNRDFDRLDRRLAGRIRQYATDVSRSGVFFRTRAPQPIGARISLSFAVIMDDVETIRGVGEVVRMCAEPRGMGVQFIELDSASRDVLARLLARASERGEARG